jgi:hypothetical protein
MSTPAYPNRAAEMRQRLLGRSSRPAKLFTSKSGAPWWVKSCTLAQRTSIMEAAGIKMGKDPSPTDLQRASALATIALVVDELGAPVFEATDLERLLSSEVGEEEAELMDAASAALGGQRKGEASEEAGAVVSPSSSQTA